MVFIVGVTIATLTGPNGILTQAQEAKKKTGEAEEIEKIKLAISEAQMGEDGYQELTTENLGSTLIKDGVKSIVSDNEDGTRHILLLDEKKEYKLDNSGNIENLNIDFDSKYVAPTSQDDERNSGVIGIGTNGEPVDMDLWDWNFDVVTNGYALNDDEVLQNTEYNPNGTNTETIVNSGYLGNIIDKEIYGSIEKTIEGCMPQYISIDNGLNFMPVTSLYRTFEKEEISLIEKLPETVLNMFCTFESCSNLSKVVIPNNVENINYCFNGAGIKEIPKLGDNIKKMKGTFSHCNSLIYANFEVPKYVEDLKSTFSFCENLKEANLILGDNIKSMRQTFYYCDNLEKGPDIIPKNVEDMNQTFQGCVKLHGEMTIKANPTQYGNCFMFVGQADDSYRLIIKEGENNREVLNNIISRSDWQKKHVIGIWDL